jgi:signal transduction histidine kinase
MADALVPIRAELERLDLLLHREILRLRARYQLSLDEFRGLYISDTQVDDLVARVVPLSEGEGMVAALTRQADRLLAGFGASGGVTPWQRLAALFRLTRSEQDVLLLGLACEVDAKYETLFAYLNNDVTRKFPTTDLARRLFGAAPGDGVSVRAVFQPDATLVRAGLVEFLAAPGRESARLTRGFRVAAPVTGWLLGLPYADERLEGVSARCDEPLPLADVPAPESVRQSLASLAAAAAEGERAVVVLAGTRGAERRRAARALHAALGRPTLTLDVDAAMKSSHGLRILLNAALLQQQVTGSALYLSRGDALFDAEGRPVADAGALALLAGAAGPVACSLPSTGRWRDALGDVRTAVVLFPPLDVAARGEIWRKRLGPDAGGVDAEDLLALIDRFALSAAQIRAAAGAARDAPRVPGAPLDGARLLAAARAQADETLGGLAPRVPLVFTWDDLVLPSPVKRRLEDVLNAVAYRPTVLGAWGFERRMPDGRGIKVLFAGASGTGKTMAAGVIARALRVDLRRIDLATVVSKYIGETEKNLERVFRAAREANAILFFDEADALFGKRSEVKDAHDRYANIEVAYLLQKMESHDGLVILATNLSRNIDEAFARRMHFVVEFPMPDAVQRERLWRQMFPAEAPLADDADLPFLARHFELAGGDIRNVALDAAYAAAAAGTSIGMPHLLHALSRQLVKSGKAASASDFKQYGHLVGTLGQPSRPPVQS